MYEQVVVSHYNLATPLFFFWGEDGLLAVFFFILTPHISSLAFVTTRYDPPLAPPSCLYTYGSTLPPPTKSDTYAPFDLFVSSAYLGLVTSPPLSSFNDHQPLFFLFSLQCREKKPVTLAKMKPACVTKRKTSFFLFFILLFLPPSSTPPPLELFLFLFL